jgi:XTP/dITP diphosphohydrolase
MLHAYEAYVDPAEGDNSYLDNAALKARALASQMRAAGVSAPVLGDDSGLEVDVLGGRPGVLSARYGGEEASWGQRRALLLAELAALPHADRTARFICALHLVGIDGREYAVVEDVEGEIAQAERGEWGFGYDAIFSYPPLGRTFGELMEEEKNAVSHRLRAVRALLAIFTRGSGVVRKKRE